jgi:hypothetical protein
LTHFRKFVFFFKLITQKVSQWIGYVEQISIEKWYRKILIKKLNMILIFKNLVENTLRIPVWHFTQILCSKAQTEYTQTFLKLYFKMPQKLSLKNVFKKPQNHSKCLTLLEKASILLYCLKKLQTFWKASHHYKKAPILLEMYLKSLAIWKNPHINKKNPQILWKCLQQNRNL